MFADRACMLTGNTLCILAALALAGCGGDNNNERTSLGGSPGSGGSTSGGSGGAGGTATASGGSSTSGGSSAVPTDPYPCENQPMATEDISANIDASGKWGSASGFNGGTFTYGMSKSDIKLEYMDHTIHVTGHVQTYAGFGLYFAQASGQDYPCVDASAFSGLSYNVVDNTDDGKVSELTVTVQTHADSPVDTTNHRGGCLYTDPNNMYADCAPPSSTAEVPEGGGVVEMPFADFAGGKPDATVDASAIDGLQWQFPWSDGADPYDVDITIKDIKFIP